MNGNNISEKNIKRILRNKVDMLEDIDRKVAALLSEMNEEDIIRERCLQTVRLSQLSSQSGVHKDLSDIIMDLDKREAARRNELSNLLINMTNEKNIINRVWAGFLILDSPYYTIMNRLYVEKGLYFTVQQELNMSQSQFERHRKKAIRKIKDYAESNSSDFIMDFNDKQILYG